jgi:hypothetical protein
VSTTVLRSSAKASIGRCNLSRISCLIGLALILSVALQAGPIDAQPSRPAQIEVVATAVPRPAQLALTSSGRLVVLSHGWRGDSAAEIYWLDPAAATPIDASLAPRLVIPFADGPRKTALGSLAVDPKSGDLFLGEENGNRIYRLAAARRLSPLAMGLNHLLGGSSLALDREGRLVVLDYASFESQLRSESPAPPALEALAVEDYTGPLVFRLNPEEDVPLPRRLELVAPIFPRPPVRRISGEPLHKFIAVAPLARDSLAVLNSVGEVLILSAEGQLRRLARLPSGHFHRTNMAVGPDGSLFVSAGFHIRELYRVTPGGVVTSVAHELGDPQGIVVDRSGALYVAETALHRIIRIRPNEP